jgi:hypothetical protein
VDLSASAIVLIEFIRQRGWVQLVFSTFARIVVDVIPAKLSAAFDCAAGTHDASRKAIILHSSFIFHPSSVIAQG